MSSRHGFAAIGLAFSLVAPAVAAPPTDQSQRTDQTATAADVDDADSSSSNADADADNLELREILKIVLRPPEDAAVCVSVSKEFVNAFFAAPVNNDSTVGAYIVGTYVTGKAETVAETTWQLRSNDDELDLEIVLQGQCDSNTVGGNGPVDVHTKTNANFTAAKRVRITPEGIHSHATRVKANELRSDAQVSSRLNGLIGRIATNIGRDIVVRKHTQVEAESRAHLQRQVSSQVDQHVNEALAKLHRMVRDAKQDENSLFERDLQLRTTDRSLILATGAVPAEVLERAESMADHEITLIMSRSLAERFSRDQDSPGPTDQGAVLQQVSTSQPRTRLLSGLRPSTRSWSDDHQWLTLGWNIDSQRIATLVQATGRLRRWVESTKSEETPASPSEPVSVKTADRTDAPASAPQDANGTRFYSFDEAAGETAANP
jgi:hypothetical protein